MPQRSSTSSLPTSVAPIPTAHIFIATSLDGFIARESGGIDWLLARDDPGYPALIKDIDAIAMGRGRLEMALRFDPWSILCRVGNSLEAQ